MKKLFKSFITLTCIMTILCGCSCSNKLPKPEISNSALGKQFGLDANINMSSIDKYLDRNDVVYRDMRMLVDPIEYGMLDGGDKYLSGFIKGFEVIPLPYLKRVTPPPVEGIGNAYAGPTLFSEVDGKFKANYKESMDILNYIFPKDKSIFLMCGGAGYAGETKTMLISLGWDANKIYNVGGYWTYKGENKVTTKLANGNYDFSKVAYHDIDFSVLTPVED